MIERNAELVRQEVNNPKKNWNIIWYCGKMPFYPSNEKVQLIYENMDCDPAICDAIYTFYDRTKKPEFIRRGDGARMVNCIAWRYYNWED